MRDCGCTDDNSSQRFPLSDTPEIRLNPSLYGLKSLDGNEEPAYSYFLTTVYEAGKAWEQTGCAPNFKGDIITLCTCKHRMRTYPKVKEGTWIAGISGVHAGDGRNSLFYLMRIGETFHSHAELWDRLLPQVRQVKSASLNRFGDVYEPSCFIVDTTDSKTNPNNYHQPRIDHVHVPHDRWRKDIDYISKNGLRPKLLVGCKERSFLWTKPSLSYTGSKPRIGVKHWDTLEEFLHHIENKGSQ